MSNGIGGFFVPGSITGSYVANKKNEEGSYKYDAQTISTGIQKQAALQDLEKSYADTINKAYSSYLANQQAIGASQMGQGYKELYEQAEQEALLAKQVEASNSVANAKAQILAQEEEAQNLIKQQYLAEVNNLDRVARTMSDYLSYVKSLEGGLEYLSGLSGIQVTKDTLAEDIYDALYNAQPQALSSQEDDSVKGISYSEWLHNQMKDTDDDIAFERWLYSGGWQDFQKYAGLYKEQTEAGKKYAEIDKARQAERQAAIDKMKADEEAKQRAEEAKRKAEEEANRKNDPNYQGYIASGGTYSKVKGGGVSMGTTLSTNISKALGTESKLDSGEWKKGDIIKYNGYYYQIVDVRTKWNRVGKYGHVSYQRINY